MAATNMRTIALLSNDNLVSMKASFNLDGETGTLYTFVLYRTLAETLKKNDLVAVRKADSSIAVVQVRELHDDNEIDVDASWNYQFAFQRIDIAHLEQLENQIDEFTKMLNKCRRDNLRQQAVAAAMQEIGAQDVKVLSEDKWKV